MATCVRCGSQYSDKRLAIGYRTCLSCGAQSATEESARKARCSAPAYNKGAYQYVFSTEEARGVGR